MRKNQNRILIIMFLLVMVNLIFSEEVKNSVGTFKEIQIKSNDLIVAENAMITSNSAILVNTGVVTTGQALEATTETAISIEKKEEKTEKYNLENYLIVEGTDEKGKATYYSKKFHGSKTTSNEKFSIYKYTGAHRTLKFGTLVKVTNLDNGKSVIVKINDRGPFSKGKIIDLSPIAFEELANLKKGILKVKIEIVKENVKEVVVEDEKLLKEEMESKESEKKIP